MGTPPSAVQRTALSLLLVALPLGGCLQVEVTVTMLDEGSALIDERVRFSSELLDLDGTSAPDRRLLPLLERPAVEQRAPLYGQGTTLVRHEVVDLPGGARESRATYRLPDLEDLRIWNPYLHQGRSDRAMKLRFEPIYQFVHSYHRVGEMMLYLVPAEAPPRSSGGESPAPAAPLTPAQTQALRDVQPAFADCLEDFQVTLRLVATHPISLGYIRDAKASSKVITFLSFSGKDLDLYGQGFIENEELMLDLMQFRMDSDTLLTHTEQFTQNPTVPVFLGRRPYASGRFRVKPTKALFQKYFAGRPKSQGGDREDVPEKP